MNCLPPVPCWKPIFWLPGKVCTVFVLLLQNTTVHRWAMYVTTTTTTPSLLTPKQRATQEDKHEVKTTQLRRARNVFPKEKTVLQRLREKERFVRKTIHSATHIEIPGEVHFGGSASCVNTCRCCSRGLFDDKGVLTAANILAIFWQLV